MISIQLQQSGVLILFGSLACWFLERTANQLQRDARRLQILLRKHEGGSPSMVEVQEILQGLNEECGMYNFHWHQHSNFPFRGKMITFIDGQVSAVGCGKGSRWVTGDRPYVLATREMAPWLAENRDAFKLAWIGERYCIAWVSLKVLGDDGERKQGCSNGESR